MKNEHDIGVTMAIVPTSRGLGYVAFENPGLVIDWGVKDVRKDKGRACLQKAGALIDLLKPSVLVVEDWQHSSSRRSRRVKELVRNLAHLGKERDVTVVRCSREEMLTVFARMGAESKDDIAGVVARYVPELGQRLPPRRRIWDSEHYSMSIFEAAALALTYFARSQGGLRISEEGIG